MGKESNVMFAVLLPFSLRKKTSKGLREEWDEPSQRRRDEQGESNTENKVTILHFRKRYHLEKRREKKRP